MIKIESHGVPHLAFDTIPWKTVEEGELIRVLFDQWRRGDDKGKPGHCLKTMEDWDDWQRFQQLYAGNRLRRQTYQARLEKADAQSASKRSSSEGSSADAAQLKIEGPRKEASRCSTGVLYATSKNVFTISSWVCGRGFGRSASLQILAPHPQPHPPHLHSRP